MSTPRTAITKLFVTPSECDIKEMQGTDKGKMRMRVGSFRVIYFYKKEVEIEILFIDEIGNRGDIYK